VSSTGALVLAGIAPGVGGHVSITPAVGSLVLAGIAPGVGGSGSITPTLGALVLTGAAPAIVQGTVLTPPAGSLYLGEPTGAAPGSGQLAAQGYPPRLDLGVLTVVRAAVLTGVAPVLHVGATLVTPAGGLTLTGAAPRMTWTVTPGAGALTLTGNAPGSTAAITPAVAALGLTGSAPSLRRGEIISCPAGSMTITAVGDTLLASEIRPPVGGLLTLTGTLPGIVSPTSIIFVHIRAGSESLTVPTIG
jgi:hypothetical protein